MRNNNADKAQDLLLGIVADVNRYIAGEPQEAMLRSVQPKVDEVIGLSNLPTLGVPRQRIHSEVSSWLYYDPMVRIALAMPESTPDIHDHGTWQILAIVHGHVRYRSWDRTDAGDTGSKAIVAIREEIELGPGDVLFMPPPPDDIHDWDVLTKNTHMISVIGPDMSSRRRYFLPDEGSYFEKNV